MLKTATVFASISGCIAVILGAMGAHNLSSKMDEGLLTAKGLHAYETAVHYQLLHSIAMIAIIALQPKFSAYFKAISYLFMAGIVLFSGSIYLLVMGDLMKINVTWAGPITPLGGLSFTLGWFMLILSALKYKSATN